MVSSVPSVHNPSRLPAPLTCLLEDNLLVDPSVGVGRLDYMRVQDDSSFLVVSKQLVLEQEENTEPMGWLPRHR